MKWSLLVTFAQLVIALPFLLSSPPSATDPRVFTGPPIDGGSIDVTDPFGGPGGSAAQSPLARTLDVSVGPGLSFVPSVRTIAVGDTVRWTWNGNNHTVTSGTPCTINNEYCSPSDVDCGSASASNANFVYSHTYTQAGTFPYFCRVHCGANMTGTITVVTPFVAIASTTRGANGHFHVSGQSVPDSTVTITSAPDLLSAFGNPQTVITDATGAFQFDDASAVGAAMRFYKASYP